MICQYCIDVRNSGRSSCKFCGASLTSETVVEIEALARDFQDKLGGDVSNDALTAALRTAQSAERQQAREAEKLAKKQADAEATRLLAEREAHEIARVARIKSQMSDIELLNYEMQEKILVALCALAEQGRSAAHQRGTTGLGIAAGLTALLASES